MIQLARIKTINTTVYKDALIIMVSVVNLYPPASYNPLATRGARRFPRLNILLKRAAVISLIYPG